MNAAFADTGHFIAVLSPADALHARAAAQTQKLGARPVVTTEMVLTELLNDFGARGTHLRQAAAQFVAQMRARNVVRILPQTPELFADALTLYRQRPDKEWSLTDCASILICQREGIADVLTHDQHFTQAGLTALLREDDGKRR